MTSVIHQAATNLADQLIEMVSKVKEGRDYPLLCRDCLSWPTVPITGPCGHTRCHECVQRNRICYCGRMMEGPTHANVMVKSIIEKLQKRPEQPVNSHQQSAGPGTSSRLINYKDNPKGPEVKQRRLKTSSTFEPYVVASPKRQLTKPEQFPRPRLGRRLCSRHTAQARFPRAAPGMARYRFALKLRDDKEDVIAVSHLVHVAASDSDLSKISRQLLILVLESLYRSKDCESLEKQLFRAVIANVPPVRLEPEDLECTVCYESLYHPITSPCGHTFCRRCILRFAANKRQCAVCRSPLGGLDIYLTTETEFLKAAMMGVIGKPSAPTDCTEFYIPITICEMAVPMQSYPIVVNSSLYKTVIKRLLDAGRPDIGILDTFEDGSFPRYGTVVHITDCLLMEDGRALISAIGKWRFKALETYTATMDILRVTPWGDRSPTVLNPEIKYQDVSRIFTKMAMKITTKAVLYFNSLDRPVRSNVDHIFGDMPFCTQEKEWWFNPDGAQWLWWLVAALPIRSDIKLLLLSTNSAQKRMEGVFRVLQMLVE